MQQRKLGGLEVSAVGLGCATMTPFYAASASPNRRRRQACPVRSFAMVPATLRRSEDGNVPRPSNRGR